MSVQVVCRVRPALTSDEGAACVAVTDDSHVSLTIDKDEQVFAFDRAFGPAATQDEVFALAKPLVDGALAGVNATIFSYGATCAGKSYTIFGPPEPWEARGVVPRCAERVFEAANSAEPGEYTLSVSFLEIYKERVRDLLDQSKTNLAVFDGDVPVPEATEVEVKSLDEVDALVKHAAAFKVTAPNRVNQQSSRSHCVLVVNILKRAGAGLRASRLVLADLAGSEKVSRTEARGLRLEEARNINRSLLALGKVVHALCARLPHVPYRDSKLTRILKQSLGGNSRTLLIVHISPCADAAAESLSTLLFASRARLVTNCPQVNSVEPGPGASSRLLKQIVLMRKLIRRLARDPGFVLSPEQEQLYASDALSDSGFAELVVGEGVGEGAGDVFSVRSADSADSVNSGDSGDSAGLSGSSDSESVGNSGRAKSTNVSAGAACEGPEGPGALRAADFCDSDDPCSVLRLQSVPLLEGCFGPAELARVREE